ncbi:hypothetical protein Pint_02466 [Pistacia integerrima]|uniref:Uncharacterized protein n=1 Tax=Pistacia integerrima TaxID=434235 RepID=A0ACC0ZLW6_9ROSI|nr:hypothetical protein Pint_02466 [Pistacia integerrima]
MKGLFSHLKLTKKKPVELVKRIRQLLIRVDKNANLCERKISELRKSILELRTVLFGDDQTEPNPKACEALTKEFFSLEKILGEDGIAIALAYGAIARECIRHQSVAKYVLESQHLKKFFRRQAVKLLGELLCCGSNSGVRVKYLSSLNNLKISLLRSTMSCSKIKTSFVQFIGGFNIDRVNEEFEADKSLVIKEITALEPRKQQSILAF